jgi:WD40 repeat protein
VLIEHLGTERESSVATGARGFAALRIPAEGAAQAVELSDRSVIIRDPSVPSGPPIARFDVPGGARPVSAVFSADGSRLAVGDDRGRLNVWNLNGTQGPIAIPRGTGRRIDRLTISDDGKRIAVHTGDGIHIFAVDAPGTPIKVAADRNAVFRFVPSGDRLVTGDRNGVVRIWSVEDGREEPPLYGHVGRITGIGISPDGRTIVSGGATGDVRFWDIRTGQELMGFQRHSEPVTVIEFSQNGKLLVTAGASQIAVWEAVD